MSKTWWCGTRVATGVKVVALVNLGYSGGLIIAEVLLYFQRGLEGLGDLNAELSGSMMIEPRLLSNATTLLERTDLDQDSNVKTIFSVPVLEFVFSLIWILTWILSVAFSLLLYHAAVKRNWGCTAIWFYYRIVTLVFRVIFLAIYLLAGLPLLPKIPVVGQFLIGLYSLWVVDTFMKELTAEKALAKNDATKDISI